MTVHASTLAFRPGQRVSAEDLVFLVGQPTPYGMLEHFSAEWVLAMRALGRNAWLLDTGGLHGLASLQALLAAGRPRAFVAFSGVNWDLLANDRLLYEVLAVPYVGLMFDDPAYFPQRHRVASPWLTYLFTDRDHHDASVALSPPTAPRGRFRFGVRPPSEAPPPFEERAHSILFAKSPGDPDADRAAWQHEAPAMRSILNDVADAALWQDARSVWAIAQERLATDGLTHGLAATIGMATIVAKVDHYVRLARAQRVVQALAPHDAVIVGEGWRAHLPARSRARIVASCTMPELLGLMAQSRVLVNVQPNNREAPHERLLFGMQRGCCVLTDAPSPMRAAVGESNVHAFRWDAPLNDVVAHLLQDPARAGEVGARARVFSCAEWSAEAGARTVLTATDSLAAVLATTSPLTFPAALSA
jgi:hypothetical protein